MGFNFGEDDWAMEYQDLCRPLARPPIPRWFGRCKATNWAVGRERRREGDARCVSEAGHLGVLFVVFFKKNVFDCVVSSD